MDVTQLTVTPGSTTGSPSGSPKMRPVESPFMQHDNSSLERHASPAPSNTSSEPRQNGHRRTDSVTLVEGDYFGGLPRLANVSSRSLPGTPRSVARNISFSPRIQFHDVWSSMEYDRRGDIATCNRLTPMLAQQIKEELNTFKMVSRCLHKNTLHTFLTHRAWSRKWKFMSPRNRTRTSSRL